MKVREVPLKMLKRWYEMADNFMCNGCHYDGNNRKEDHCRDCGTHDILKDMKSVIRGDKQ